MVPVQTEEPSALRVDTGCQTGYVEWAHATDDGGCGDPARHRSGAGQGVGGTPGPSHDGERAQPDTIGERGHIRRPVGDPAPRLEVGPAAPGPIHSDQTGAHPVGD